MTNRMTVSFQEKPCYDIIFEHDFGKLGAELEALGCGGKRLCIVSDSNVVSLYADAVKEAVHAAGAKADIFVLSGYCCF